MMNSQQLREIAGICRSAIDEVPKPGGQQSSTSMFSALRSIGVACLDRGSLLPELRAAVPIPQQGPLYQAARSVSETVIFSSDVAPQIIRNLEALESILLTAANAIDPRKKLSTGEFTIFYSWQATLPNSTNRGFIKKALEKAVDRLVKGNAVQIKPIIDSDTANTPGSPDVIAVILSKIEAASVFVADVSIVDEKQPSANVIFELGYAMRCLGAHRIIMVYNEAYGSTRDLPFDLGFKRQILYRAEQSSADRSTERDRLSVIFQAALGAIIEEQ